MLASKHGLRAVPLPRGVGYDPAMLVFAAIAPHAMHAVLDGEPPGAETRSAMAELGSRFNAARPDAVIVLTPHTVHVEGAMAVVTASSAAGDLAQWGAADVKLRVPLDTALSVTVRDAIRAAHIPVVGVSYGGNNQSEAVMPMDWATLIPLWWMGGRSDPQVPAVIVSPARDLSVESHVQAGAAIAGAVSGSDRRVALVASCDHGHGHLKDGPYGFRPESAIYDELVCSIVRDDRLADVADIDAQLVRAAAADSWWQLLMLAGALDGGWTGQFLAYERPTYVGLMCAAYAPPASSAG
ncbi:MAG TPA: extradiol ring-cleavage dioxygenase [Candidatus Dormibacteraeota bacterium]|nr:extradiol ring-cleavage dioxygenase [Candidatus Dormibacteraeota bacterium]